MRTCEASGLNTEWIRDHVDGSHMCLNSEEKPCHLWQPEPWAGWVAPKGGLVSSGLCAGSLQLATSWWPWRQTAKCRIVSSRVQLSAAVQWRCQKPHWAAYPSRKWIPCQCLQWGVGGCEMAKIRSWKRLCLLTFELITTMVGRGFPPFRLNDFHMLWEVWVDSATWQGHPEESRQSRI